jgi:hypothetical protein
VLERAHGPERSVEPYERLASVLRATGDEQTARRALARRERLVTAQQKAAFKQKASRLGSMLYGARRRTYDAVVGYGYAEARALLSLGLVFLVALALTHYAVDAGQIRSRTQAACAKPPCPAEPATVNEIVFAAERVIPAVDLGERSRVRVTGATATGLALCSLLGWILTIALLAAAAKTLRRD